MTKPKKILLIILLAAFIFSLSYSFYFKIQPSVDARAYNNIAINIVRGFGYTENPNLSQWEELSISRMGPGYELFLAVIYLIFGIHLSIVWIINALLLVISGYLIFKITTKLFFNETMALIATFLYIFFIDVLQVTSMLLTENLYLFLIILTFYLLLKLIEKNNLTNQFIFAASCAVTVLVRSTFLATLGLLFVYFIFKKNYRVIILTLVAVVLILLPWGLRNYRVYHKFMLSNVALGYNLWAGNNPESNGEQQGTPLTDNYLDQYGIIKMAEHGLGEYKNFILTQPVAFVKLQLLKTIKYFSLVRVSAFWFHLHGIFRIFIGLWSGFFASLIFIFGSLGLYQSLKKKKNYFLLLFVISFPLSVIPFLVENRYRWPIYPFLAIVAAYSLYKVYKKEIPFKKVMISGLIFIIITLIDIAVSYQDVISHINNI